jgi:hypothetical protein
MARGNRLLVCFSHRRLFHPFDHVWIPFPACLRDWPEEQTGRHWLFTAAPCNYCLESHPEAEEKAQARPRILRPQSTPHPKGKVYKGRRAGRRQRPTSA